MLLDLITVTGGKMQQDVILKLPQVQAITGISRSGIYARIKAGTFPKQIKLSERSSGWIEREVYAFIQQCIQTSRSKI